MVVKACIKCKRLTPKSKCPYHPEAKLSDSWKGEIVVLDPEKSEIAKKLNIERPGKYALRL